MGFTLATFHPPPPGDFNSCQVVDADTNNLAPTVGFAVDETGTLSFRLRADSALVAVPVAKHTVYYGDIAQVDITGSTTVTEVYLFRRI